MKRKTIFTALAVVLMLCTVLPAWADKCKKVKADQSVTVNNDGTTDGIITKGGLLNGTTHAIFTSVFTPTPDPGTFSFTAQLTITTDKGVLTLSDVAVFDVANGVFTDISRVVGSESTGIFEGATGILFISGKTTDGVHFEDEISGEICLARTVFEDDDDD